MAHERHLPRLYDAINAMNIPHYVQMALLPIEQIAAEHMRPSVLFRPTLQKRDGDGWIASYGDNIMSNVWATGETPDAAMRAFDVAWNNKLGIK